MFYIGLAVGALLGSCILIIFLALTAELASKVRAGAQNNRNFEIPSLQPSLVAIGNEQRERHMTAEYMYGHFKNLLSSEYLNSRNN